MKAKFEISFSEVNNVPISDTISFDSNFQKSVNKLCGKIIDEMTKFFAKSKVKVKMSYKLYPEER